MKEKEIQVVTAGSAKFPIGFRVRHRIYGFRGVIFDVDPVFANTEEWYQSIPAESRPSKDQPFYHLFAETTEKKPYIAYVSQQNLEADQDPAPVNHPSIAEFFEGMRDGRYVSRRPMN